MKLPSESSITRRTLLQSIAVGTAFGWPPQGNIPIHIERDIPQLFVDDFLIEDPARLARLPYPRTSEESFTRTLRQPKKDDGGNVPVLALDKEFGQYPRT